MPCGTWDPSSQPGVKPVSRTLGAGVLTGPPGEFPPPSSVLIEILVGHMSAPSDDGFTHLYLQLGAATRQALDHEWNSPVMASGNASQETTVW